ncbi:DUF6062 family protein [Spirochaeta isovalerica]|uniref:ABC transporter substrate-binding protein n=1 Tax=Spirochaeta isovalerica TaxID=150 RepID=A0A841R601_9SPIO|nr:DUF6062 family protein [Spirochaeta isovalerica]MBB6478439.1 hypothetical protein [Spirochaeta isovalerica]
MKYKLETIPVWDAFKEDTECPICDLAEKAEERYLKFYLGSSVMNPETRVEVNKTGFCPDHFTGLLAERSNHGLGLMTHTHLEKRMELLRPYLKSLKSEAAKASGKLGPLKPRKLMSSISDLEKHLSGHEESCMICDRIDYTLKRYTFTIVHLWKTDEEFRDVFGRSRGFCFHHLPDLLKMAEEILSPGKLAEFTEEVVNLIEENNLRLEKEILWFTQKFDSQNFDKPWGTSEDAHYRTIQKLTGRSNRKIKK